MTQHWTQFCRAAKRQPGQMNKTEQEYAAQLQTRVRIGELEWWAYEPMKFRLADNTFYTPDFAVLRVDGILEFHEVKGAPWTDDARVKIKVAAEIYWMFVFRGLRKEKHDWKIETFSREEK